MPRLPLPRGTFLDRHVVFKVINGVKTWWDAEAQRYYQWDAFHGEIEVYNARGKHIGVMDVTGREIKDSVRGRKINVS